MKLGCAGEPHLTYCTNIHPGESWKEVRGHLENGVREVKRALGVERFGVGLRLSALAAQELARPEELARLRKLLHAHGLYVFTLNGFPYGVFHGRRVKAEVYLPDWRSPERVAYSDRLAGILAELLPEDTVGSVSTVPGAFAPSVRGADDERAIARNLIAHALHLAALRDERGVSIALALEPEPACMLETVEQSIAFFERHLLGREALASVARVRGGTPAESETLLRRHLGLCLDACHAAVEFEDPLDAVERLERAGIAVAKLQLSVGLRVARVGPASEALLAPFDDDVYLHQVVESRGGALRRYVDLCDAFAALRERGAGGGDAPAEWRVHCHVPIFRDPAAPLSSTRPVLEALLERQRTRPFSTHLEVETYTWDVLPASQRGPDVVSDIVSELRFVRERLRA